MKNSKLLRLAVSGLTVAATAVLAVSTSDPADADGFYYPGKWGVIGRNSSGNPNAVLRLGPWGRPTSSTPSAATPPPYGIGSLGLIVGGNADHIQFGNQTEFAGVALSSINVLKYWVFADSDTLPRLPNINMEVDPDPTGTVHYSSLVYLPNLSAGPSAPASPTTQVWQQYDASAAGSMWYATGATGASIGCQAPPAGTPCSFADLKTKLPNAVITLSVAINKGSADGSFFGAVDGLQINNALYDFEPLGVRKFQPFS